MYGPLAKEPLQDVGWAVRCIADELTRLRIELDNLKQEINGHSAGALEEKMINTCTYLDEQIVDLKKRVSFIENNYGAMYGVM